VFGALSLNSPRAAEIDLCVSTLEELRVVVELAVKRTLGNMISNKVALPPPVLPVVSNT